MRSLTASSVVKVMDSGDLSSAFPEPGLPVSQPQNLDLGWSETLVFRAEKWSSNYYVLNYMICANFDNVCSAIHVPTCR